MPYRTKKMLKGQFKNYNQQLKIGWLKTNLISRM